MLKFVSLILAFTLPLQAFAEPSNCISLFEHTPLSEAEDLSHKVAKDIESELTQNGFSGPQKRGYAILIGTMVGSALLSTYMTSNLGPHFQFLSVFVSQVSTLGVFVLGAPIWEPLSSKFRQLAFGVKKSSQLTDLNNNPNLESTWVRSQENYSINAQMSRNVITQFITSVRQNFYEAYRAFNNDDKNYAADQVAEAAFRLRTLFRDIPPNDPSVAAAVNTAFTNHIEMNEEFVELVWSKLEELDENFTSPEIQKHYQITLETWLH